MSQKRIFHAWYFADKFTDREEATREGDFTLNEDDDDDDEEEVEEWDGKATWDNDGDDAKDVKDESAAYLEFLKEEVFVLH